MLGCVACRQMPLSLRLQAFKNVAPSVANDFAADAKADDRQLPALLHKFQHPLGYLQTLRELRLIEYFLDWTVRDENFDFTHWRQRLGFLQLAIARRLRLSEPCCRASAYVV